MLGLTLGMCFKSSYVFTRMPVPEESAKPPINHYKQAYQKCTQPSAPPETSVLPSPEYLNAVTARVWTCKVCVAL